MDPATVHAIVEEHGGWVESKFEPGSETRLSVYLPMLEQEAAAGDQQAILDEAEIDLPAEEGKMILVVEDEEPVRRALAMILRISGYTILLAVDGEDGLAIFESRQEEIDLVILDLAMPKMSGQEVLPRLLALDPQVKAIICTGYNVNDDEVEGASALIKKPFLMRTLVETVGEVLGAP